MNLKLFTRLVLLSAIFSLNLSAQTPPNDKNIEGLTGAVKRIDEQEATLKLKNGVFVEGARRPSRILIFDKQGRITYEWVQLEKLTPSERFSSYDKENNRHLRSPSSSPFSSENKGKFLVEYLYLDVLKFDSAENILTKEVYVGDKPLPNNMTQKYKYHFDKDGKIFEKFVLTTKDVEAGKDVYIYGAERLPTEIYFSETGNPFKEIIKYAYVLDAVGNWTKQTALDTFADYEQTHRTKVTYRKISYYK